MKISTIMMDIADEVCEVERIISLARAMHSATTEGVYSAGELEGACSVLLQHLCSHTDRLKEISHDDDTQETQNIGIGSAMAIYRHSTDSNFLIQAAWRIGYENGRGEELTCMGFSGKSDVDKICKEILNEPVDLHLEDAENCRTLKEFSETIRKKGW